jgi:hypothetical protein
MDSLPATNGEPNLVPVGGMNPPARAGPGDGGGRGGAGDACSSELEWGGIGFFRKKEGRRGATAV